MDGWLHGEIQMAVLGALTQTTSNRNAGELSTVQITYGYSTALELESTTVHLMTSVTSSLGELVAVTVLSISGSRRQKDFRRMFASSFICVQRSPKST